MKKITITELRATPLEQLDKECLEVTANCEHLAFFIPKTQGAMREKVRAIMGQIEAGGL